MQVISTRKLISIALCCLLNVVIICAQTNGLEVEGAILLRPSHDLNPQAGTLRWTGSDVVVWNGVKWLSLLNGAVLHSEVVDIDGNTYPVVKIGELEIMAENLKTSHYNNGDPIPEIKDGSSWGTLGSGAWCWYQNDSNMDSPFGKLYNWYAVTDTRSLCPVGWSPLTLGDWSGLIDILGSIDSIGRKMKESGSARWSSHQSATNESGFSATGSGYRSEEGLFQHIFESGIYWTPNEDPTTHGFLESFTQSSDALLEVSKNKKSGASVRCKKK